MTAEEPYRWRLVLTGDLAQSKRGDWVEVLEVRTKGDRVYVRFVGISTLFDKAADDTVMIRRSEMGAAVDLFAVVFSGPSGEVKP